jgi:hypothetical protein
MEKTCKEYQDDIKIKSVNDETARKDKEALEVLKIRIGSNLNQELKLWLLIIEND